MSHFCLSGAGDVTIVRTTRQVEAPVLFVAARKDQLCPADTVQKAADEAPRGKISIHDVTHFEIYLGDTLQVRGI